MRLIEFTTRPYGELGPDTDRDGLLERVAARDVLLPALKVAPCPSCLAPRRTSRARCTTCSLLFAAVGCQLSSIEFVTMARSDHRMHEWIRGWKDSGAPVPPSADEMAQAGTGPMVIAAALSAYLQAHQERVLAGEPIVTFVPTRAPVIARAAQIARLMAWYMPDIQSTGRKSAGPQRYAGRDDRIRLCADDWTVMGHLDRPVLLLDDIYTTGASMHSYAAALRRAGARDVRGIVFERVVGGHAYDDHLLHLRSNRAAEPWQWRADRDVVADLR